MFGGLGLDLDLDLESESSMIGVDLELDSSSSSLWSTSAMVFFWLGQDLAMPEGPGWG